jgi:hypothetical protein
MSESNSFELMEPRSPESLVPDAWFEPWMVAVAAGALLILIGVLLLLNRRRPANVDPLAEREAAHAEAVTALAAIGGIPARDAAVQASLIVRKYLALAAGDPALYETQEETIARHHAFHAFSDEARAVAAAGFATLAGLKYTPGDAAIAADEVKAHARSLLEVLHHGFRV